MSRLTGKTRFRAGFFGKLILQVQVTYEEHTYAGESRDHLIWRDATAKDVLRGDLGINQVFKGKG